MKKALAMAMASVMILGLAACGPKDTAGSAGSTPSGSVSSSVSAQGSSSAVAQLDAPIAEGPVLLSTAGQSADVEMVKVLLEKAGLTCTMDNAADGTNLGDAKTLVLAVGGSSKGLGAAGTDADSEIARVDALTKAAKDAGMTVIAVHVGGTARRGDLSDKFLKPGFDRADYAVVVESGDADGKMAGMAAEHGIPMAYADSMATVVDPLKAAFK